MLIFGADAQKRPLGQVLGAKLVIFAVALAGADANLPMGGQNMAVGAKTLGQMAPVFEYGPEAAAAAAANATVTIGFPG